MVRILDDLLRLLGQPAFCIHKQLSYNLLQCQKELESERLYRRNVGIIPSGIITSIDRYVSNNEQLILKVSTASYIQYINNWSMLTMLFLFSRLHISLVLFLFHFIVRFAEIYPRPATRLIRRFLLIWTWGKNYMALLGSPLLDHLTKLQVLGK